MGGKTGTSSTSVEIPEELNSMVFPFLQDAISRYDQFASQGASKIMPNEGYTNVNVRNPWDPSSGGESGPGGGMPSPTDPATTPTDPASGGTGQGGGGPSGPRQDPWRITRP